MRRGHVAAIGKRHVSGNQLEQRHLGGAESQGQVVVDVRLNAQPARGSRHTPAPGFERQPDGDRVDRTREGLAHGHGTEILILVVGWPPAIDVDGSIFHDRVRREARLERREIDERFEGRAGLAA